MKKVCFSRTLGIVEKNSIHYIQAVFDALKNGVVVVPIRALDDTSRLDMIAVTESVSPDDGGGWLTPQLVLPAKGDDAIAHVAFTSGTEGPPKGVCISRAALNDTIARVQSVMQMDHTVREYIGVPVYHSFGYGRCRHVAMVGGRFYLPHAGFDPRELSNMLTSGEVNALSLVPSLLRLFFDNPDVIGEERLQLRWLEIGSQAMTKTEKRKIRELFPNARIVQHYGLTEASRTTLLQIDGAEDRVLDSVGLPVGDVQLSISAQGCIKVKGPHLATQWIKDGELVSAVNDDGWLHTTDLGQLRDGYLYFAGRADNVVNCGGQKLSTETLEVAIKQQLQTEGHHQWCDVFAVSRIVDSLYGEAFLLSFTAPNAIDMIKVSAVASLKTLGIHASNAIRFHYVQTIPKTHTGKIQHKALSSLYEQHVVEKTTPSPTSSSKDQRILNAFADSLGLPLSEIQTHYSANEMGIDSLQAVQLALKLERQLGYLPPNWRQQTISSLLLLSTATLPPASTSSSAAFNKAPPLGEGSSNRNPMNMGLWALLKEDFNTHDREIFSQGLFALSVHRFGNWRMGIRSRYLRFPMTVLYRVLRKVTQIACGIKLDYTVQVGRRVKLEHFGGMILGARAIGDDTIIRQNTTFGIAHMSDLSAKPVIEHGVNIGAGAVIVGDITIGRYSVIGPNSVVTDNVPPFSVVSAGATIVTRVGP